METKSNEIDDLMLEYQTRRMWTALVAVGVPFIGWQLPFIQVLEKSHLLFLGQLWLLFNGMLVLWQETEALRFTRGMALRRVFAGIFFGTACIVLAFWPISLLVATLAGILCPCMVLAKGMLNDEGRS